MTKKIHNYHFGQWPEMPWKENKMNDIKNNDYASWCALMLSVAVEEAYENEVVLTEMEKLIEATKEEWIEDKLQEWEEEVKRIYGAKFLKEDK